MSAFFLPAALGVLAVIALCCRVRLLHRLGRALLGVAGLAAVNLAGGAWGLSLGINLANVLTAGILGLPGVALLCLLRCLY